MPTLRVDQKRGVEDLERLVGVERRDDLRQGRQVPVEELAQARVVLERAAARAPGDEELEAGRAERVLHVDEQKTGPEAVSRCGRDAVLLRPGGAFGEPGFVVDSPHLGDAVAGVVGGQRQLAQHERRLPPDIRREFARPCPAASLFPRPGSRERSGSAAAL